MVSVHVALLGHPAIERDGRTVQVDTRKAVALLAYLAMKDRPQSRDSLTALLWSEYDMTSGRAALRRTLSTLRSAIGESHIEADRRVVRLIREHLDIDVDRFRSALGRARSHGHDLRQACSACLPALTEAATLWRGDFLEGFSLRDAPEFEDWQMIEAEAIRRDLAQVLEGASTSSAAAGDFETSIAQARRWLSLDRFHEPAHRALMRLYSLVGQRSSALQQYRECVRVLEEELAVAPVEETTRLYQSIKEGGEGLPARAPAPRPLAHPTASQLPLVGRTREWARLVEECDAMAREGHVVVLEGEAGIGKTRLMDELLTHARSLGALTISTRCYEGETGLAYAPVIQLLRGSMEALEQAALQRLSTGDRLELSRLLPEFGDRSSHDQPVPPLDTTSTEARFLNSVIRTLLAPADDCALLLAVDDLQWADAASLECLLYLLRRLGNRPASLVLTWRTEGLPPAHVLRRALTEAERRGRGAILRLERLDKTAVDQLVDEVGVGNGTRDRSGLGAWLFEETEGLPLFLEEYVAAVRSHPPGGAPGGTASETIPRGVKELLESRLTSVTDVGWQYLTVAAVLGRSFDLNTLLEVSGRDEEMTISGLEELTAQGLIHEVRASGYPVYPGTDSAYDFSHDKLRALVYEQTSLPRRRLLHRRVAETLAARSRRAGDDALAGTVAQHYLLAGAPTDAAHYHWRAGLRARALYANREALAHFEAALALGPEDLRAVQEALGDLHTLLGEYQAAVTRYESAAALSAGLDLARIEHKLGGVHDRWGERELADAHFEAALQALGDGPAGDRARIYADRAMTAHHRGNDGEAARLARTSLTLAEEAQDEQALARAYNMLGILEAGSGHLTGAADHLQESLTHAERLSDPAARIPPLHNLAFVRWRQGILAGALELAQLALGLCATQGDRHGEAALHNTVADLLYASGEGDAAMEHLKQAVIIFSEIGVDAGEVRPEVWKLTEW